MNITVARLLAPRERPESAVAAAKAIPAAWDGKRQVPVRHLDGYVYTPSPDGGRVEWQAEVK